MNPERILLEGLLLVPGLVIGLTCHEAAHALSAKLLGDRTAEKMGRISLNPFRHLSLLGTAALFILHFGWGKPVLVNLYNFKRPKFYYLLSSLAGPFVNLLLSGLALGLLYLTVAAGHIVSSIDSGLVSGRVLVLVCLILAGIYEVNALLAVFNLLPIPPLDGSKIWPCIIPGMRPVTSAKWNNLWLIVLFAIIFTNSLDKIMGPIFGFVDSLLPWAKASGAI